MESRYQKCPLCMRPELVETLVEAWWTEPQVVEFLSQQNPDWRLDDGACPACIQEALLHVLLSQGDEGLHQQIQHLWPLDARAAFGAIPTPLRMHADPRFTGRGVTLAIVDEGFYPHADLVQPSNRIRVWVNATADPVKALYFDRQTLPTWPEWDTVHNRQWHGTMTSTVAAGSGRMSHGLYRGIASEADLVLIQVENNTQNITDQAIMRALTWIADNSQKLNIRVVNLSIGSDESDLAQDHPVNQAVHRLVAQGVVVVAAAGNDGIRKLIPPASAPEAITVGGLDDHSLFSHQDRTLWHSNYGVTQDVALKPELVAPSIWVAAPVLPGSRVEREARSLFEQRHRGANAGKVEERIQELKLITPHYQHVDGTSFAAPTVTGVVACMLEANPKLNPAAIRQLLQASAELVPGADRERQGAGVVSAGRAVAMALEHQHGNWLNAPQLPYITKKGITFVLHDHDASRVQLAGSWDNWSLPITMEEVEQGVWQIALNRTKPGRYLYKFILDGDRWLDDPSNPRKVWDGFRGFNSLLFVGNSSLVQPLPEAKSKKKSSPIVKNSSWQ